MDKTTDNGVYEGRIIMEVERDGKIIDRLETKNVIVDVGLQHILDGAFGLSGWSMIDTWYLGLLKNYTPNSGTLPSDVISSANEFIDYNPTTRPSYDAVRTNQTVSNSASTAAYTITVDNSDVYGAYIISSNVKNAGSSSALIAAGNFSTPRTGLQVDDIIYVTYEITATSA